MSAREPKLDIEGMEARANAATDGPWVSAHPVDICVTAESTVERVCTVLDDEGQGDAVPLDIAQADVNAEFIAHAREDIPALIARVRELEAEIEVWKSKSGLIRAGDPDAVRPEDLGVFVKRLQRVAWCARDYFDADGTPIPSPLSDALAALPKEE